MKKLITFLFFVIALLSYTVAQETPINSCTQSSDKSIVRFPDVKARFPGGNEALLTWLGENGIYPQEAIDNNIQGTVVVEFAVCVDGSIDKVRAIKKVHESLDAEAVRVVKSMPHQWIPGKTNGVNVASWIQLPIQFVKPKTELVTKKPGIIYPPNLKIESE